MSEHRTLYRKYRPQDFASLVGQNHIRTALSNAVSSGKIAHAFIFAGPRGTGKTSTARILAKALNCDEGPTATPCNHCENCELITKGASMDVVEIDAASNRGIDQIRELRENVAFAPVSGRYKVYIIDEVHMLTKEAFNGFLKVLEEPPAHAIFVLATTEPQAIPATIHSRCQRYDFRRVTVEDIVGRLREVIAAENIKATDEALSLIALQAEGGMRDALSLLEQCSVMGAEITADTVREVLGIVGRESLRSLITLVGEGNLSGALQAMNELYNQGKDARRIAIEAAEYLRALLLYKSAAGFEEIYLTDTAENFARLAPLYTEERILAATARLHKVLEELRYAIRGKIFMELCLFDLCHIKGDSIEALAARVAELEKKIRNAEFGMLNEERDSGHGAQATGHSESQSFSKPETGNRQKAKGDSEGEGRRAKGEGTRAPQPESSTPKPEGPIANCELRIANCPSAPAPKPQAPNSVETLWQQVVAAAEKSGKKTLVAYIRAAWPVALRGDCLVAGIETDMGRKRLESKDYKNFITETLQQVTGKPVDFACETGERPSLKPEELSKTARDALEVFGGRVEK